ncbi:hypothetical protein [Kitasatospora sp. GAS204B]|uniref:hypothetical protein n=1 Tax=unclassified Kitasatospora TaxID=2633591 RepID=UPI002474DB12|nr:hypothetical protein [Kitasatospora sp. GAS204B]MDH6122698.1 hypothetical protein [Kitasatospora sp. GAS204B]
MTDIDYLEDGNIFPRELLTGLDRMSVAGRTQDYLPSAAPQYLGAAGQSAIAALRMPFLGPLSAAVGFVVAATQNTSAEARYTTKEVVGLTNVALNSTVEIFSEALGDQLRDLRDLTLMMRSVTGDNDPVVLPSEKRPQLDNPDAKPMSDEHNMRQAQQSVKDERVKDSDIRDIAIGSVLRVSEGVLGDSVTVAATHGGSVAGFIGANFARNIYAVWSGQGELEQQLKQIVGVEINQNTAIGQFAKHFNQAARDVDAAREVVFKELQVRLENPVTGPVTRLHLDRQHGKELLEKCGFRLADGRAGAAESAEGSALGPEFRRIPTDVDALQAEHDVQHKARLAGRQKAQEGRDRNLANLESVTVANMLVNEGVGAIPVAGPLVLAFKDVGLMVKKTLEERMKQRGAVQQTVREGSAVLAMSAQRAMLAVADATSGAAVLVQTCSQRIENFTALEEAANRARPRGPEAKTSANYQERTRKSAGTRQTTQSHGLN